MGGVEKGKSHSTSIEALAIRINYGYGYGYVSYFNLGRPLAKRLLYYIQSGNLSGHLCILCSGDRTAGRTEHPYTYKYTKKARDLVAEFVYPYVGLTQASPKHKTLQIIYKGINN